MTVGALSITLGPMRQDVAFKAIANQAAVLGLRHQAEKHSRVPGGLDDFSDGALDR